MLFDPHTVVPNWLLILTELWVLFFCPLWKFIRGFDHTVSHFHFHRDEATTGRVMIPFIFIMISFIATLILTVRCTDRYGRFLQPIVLILALMIITDFMCAYVCGLHYLCVILGATGIVGTCICVYLLHFREGFYFFERQRPFSWTHTNIMIWHKYKIHTHIYCTHTPLWDWSLLFIIHNNLCTSNFCNFWELTSFWEQHILMFICYAYSVVEERRMVFVCSVCLLCRSLVGERDANSMFPFYFNDLVTLSSYLYDVHVAILYVSFICIGSSSAFGGVSACHVMRTS